jgi:aspartate/tyrosine/aromatic aminotransferase
MWTEELADMARRINTMRTALVAALTVTSGANRTAMWFRCMSGLAG